MQRPNQRFIRADALVKGLEIEARHYDPLLHLYDRVVELLPPRFVDAAVFPANEEQDLERCLLQESSLRRQSPRDAMEHHVVLDD